MSNICLDTSMENARKAKIEVLGIKALPAFKDYRIKNDAVMVPDRGFVKQLKTLDPEFEVLWDWGAEKWEIWKFPKQFGQAPYHITTVQTKDKNYRELGADVLLKLQWGDPTRFTLTELVNYFDEMDNQVIRRKQKDFTDKISDITLSTKNYVNTLMIQVPKSLKIRRMINND